jgi:acetyltransferase-like isoleucine patch superfamily enzyme
MIYQDREKNIHIEAENLELGNNLKLGKDIYIKVRGTFKIGDNSFIGDRFKATAEEIIIGDYFFNVPTDSRGMLIGGGGSNFPDSKLKIGHRCVCHTGHINLAAPVTIGDDVGLSHDVDIITHGFWASVLEGYPRNFSGVNIGNNVIIGWKTVIMPGINIANNVVVGSCSNVIRSLSVEKSIYVGNPAKFIKEIKEPTIDEKIKILDNIINEFIELMSYYSVSKFKIYADYPYITINDLILDIKNFTFKGTHDQVTDAFRDFIRRYGIRIFAPQGFLFKLNRK